MTITAPEITSAITVEDKEALASLPVGTELLEADGYSFTKNDDEETWTVVSPDGFTYNDWNDWDIEFPAIVQNPEILGFPANPYAVGQRVVVTGTDGNHGFYVGQDVRVIFEDDGDIFLATSREDLAALTSESQSYDVWERGVTAWLEKGENSQPYFEPAIEEPFQVGDRVRIALSYSLPDFRGLTAKVIGLGDWGPDDVHIEPETSRPDGFGRSPFHVYSYSLEPVVDEPQPEILDVYVAPLGTAIVETVTETEVIRNPFDLDPLPIGTLVQSTDGLYLAVKGVEDTWLNPAADDANAFIWTALTGLAAATVGVEVLYQPVAA